MAIILYYDYGEGDPKPCPQQVENLKAMDRKRVHPRKKKQKKMSTSKSKSKESPYDYTLEALHNKSFNKLCLWCVLFDDGDEEWWDQTALKIGLKVYL